MNRISVRMIATGAAGLLVLAACGTSSDTNDVDGTAAASSGSSHSGSQTAAGIPDTIRVTMDVPTTFDPVHALGLPDFIVGRASFDTLVRKDDSGLVPGLAESWTASPTALHFQLRDGATCSDSTPITATVVKNSLDYLVKAEGPNGAFTFGPNTPVITADDAAKTVDIALTVPWPTALQALSVAVSGIICPAGLAAPDKLATGHVDGAESGPYILSAAEPGVSYTYTLRDDYKAWPKWTTSIPGKPAKTVKYILAPDTSAASNLVLDGQLDIAKIMEESISRFDTSKGYKVSNFPFGDFYIVFNERSTSPFADIKLRKAAVQALNREQFTDIATSGLGTVATTFAKAQAQCVDGNTDALQPFDPGAAKALAGVKIRIIGPNVIGTNGAGNTYVQEMLRAAGADATLENVDVGTWISKVFSEPATWDMTVYADLNFLGSLASPILNFTGPEVLDGGTNIAGAHDPEVDDAFTAFLGSADTDAQCGHLRDAANALARNAHGAPLAVEPYLFVQRPGVSVTMLGGSLDDQILRITD